MTSTSQSELVKVIIDDYTILHALSVYDNSIIDNTRTAMHYHQPILTLQSYLNTHQTIRERIGYTRKRP